MTFNQKLFCNDCRRPTNHDVIEENGVQFKRIVPRIRTNDKQFLNMEDIYYLAYCQGCDSIKLVKEFHYEKENQWNSLYHIYPDPMDRMDKVKNVTFANLPKSIFLLLPEVYGAYASKSLQLCTVGLRMLIEAICIDKNVEGNTLVQKIDKLKDTNLVTELQAKILHEIRLLGNKSAHEVVRQEEELILDGLNTINSLLFNIYSLEIIKIYDKDKN
ncbi:DUF4145 domain-containing protein [Paenibacillus sp. CMAA1739]|nr:MULTISPECIES: DUF4145 domain-containing protein [Paenibacillus]MDP1509227.1 DUF4145 domain-containing protein [Paenibacillus ottowii]MEC4564646.1 DUF4145 domain-containing protein [Paenibacillus sp. CMAA1739]